MKIIYLCKLLSILQIYISAISNIGYPLFLICTYAHIIYIIHRTEKSRNKRLSLI